MVDNKEKIITFSMLITYAIINIAKDLQRPIKLKHKWCLTKCIPDLFLEIVDKSQSLQVKAK